MKAHFAFSMMGIINTSKSNNWLFQSGKNKKKTISWTITIYSIDKKIINDNRGVIIFETKTHFFNIVLETFEIFGDCASGMWNSGMWNKASGNSYTKKVIISKMVNLI